MSDVRVPMPFVTRAAALCGARRLAVACGALLLVLGLCACQPARSLAAALRSTSDFQSSPEDPRVFFERGAEAMARTVAAAMPGAIEDVERRMSGPFTIPVRVYVCATVDSMVAYGANPRAGGLTINHRVFLSPKPENTAERIPRVLRHELSHLHLGQKRGLLSFAELPVWFVEGLGVEVSDGGGAEGVSEEEAWRAIAEGRSFVPATDRARRRAGAGAYGLPEHLFYRQAGLFVAYLRSIDRWRFDGFLRSVEGGEALAAAFQGAFGTSLDEVWARFRSEAAARSAPQ